MEKVDKVDYLQYLKKGGKSGIHIKPENRGKFSRSAKAAGRSVQEHARHVVNDPNATTLQKRRAQFALNSKKWKHQEGGLVYNPFITESVSNQKRSNENNAVLNYTEQPDYGFEETPFPVEPVKFEDLSDYVGLGTYQVPHYENKVTRGVTEFKTDNIDVGNMRELLDKFEEVGISVRVTSGRDNRKTKSGKVSKHAVADAIDITPIKGETYENLRNKIMSSPELLEWMRDNQIGIIDETDPLMKAKTGATGNHWHISRGGERLALLGFSRLFG